MKTIPASWQDALKRTNATEAFAWCLTIPVAQDGQTIDLVLAVTTHNEPITIGGTTWKPYPMKLSAIGEDQSGNLPVTQLSISNVSRMLLPYFHPTNDDGAGRGGMSGRVVSSFMCRVADPTEHTEDYNFVVRSSGADLDTITLRLEPPSWWEKELPQQRFNPGLCRFKFGDIANGCVYVQNAAAAHSSCNGNFEQCSERGADMEARGLGADLLPQGFGGFRGLVL